MSADSQRPGSNHVEVSRWFGAGVDAPRAARHFVAETLVGTGMAEVMDDAKLVVTELAANAVMHARSDFTVSVCVSEEELAISVSDDSPEPPALSHRPGRDGRGRGLAIVAKVATRWGTEPTAAGKRVWVRLRLDGGGTVRPNRS